jgi:chromosome segregation ATPase
MKDSLTGDLSSGGTQNAAIATELEGRRAQYATRRRELMDAAYEQARAIEQEIRDAQAMADAARVDGDPAEDVQAALNLVEEQKKRLQQAQAQARRRLDDNPELKTIQEGMDRLIESAENMDSDQISGMKDKNKQIVELDARAARLRQAHAKLKNRGSSS